jgi:hypothetical protein
MTFKALLCTKTFYGLLGNFRETTKVVNSLFGSIAVIARWRRSSPVRASLSIIPIRRQVASI